LIIGAGQTISNMARFLQKHKEFEFTIFNRSVENAESLGDLLQSEVHPLSKLSEFEKGFDLMITCTGASEPIITPEIYAQLAKDGKQKVIIDLALPSDIEGSILREKKLNYIGLEDLKSVARKNLAERQKELEACKSIVEKNIQEFRLALRERQIELAMKDVPEMIKEIKERALNSVFEKEVNELDENSRKVLNEVLTYFEKKYISVPMKMAKNIMKKD
jgi:glutamyl-tRNA reductase